MSWRSGILFSGAFCGCRGTKSPSRQGRLKGSGKGCIIFFLIVIITDIKVEIPEVFRTRRLGGFGPCRWTCSCVQAARPTLLISETVRNVEPCASRLIMTNALCSPKLPTFAGHVPGISRSYQMSLHQQRGHYCHIAFRPVSSCFSRSAWLVFRSQATVQTAHLSREDLGMLWID